MIFYISTGLVEYLQTIQSYFQCNGYYDWKYNNGRIDDYLNLYLLNMKLNNLVIKNSSNLLLLNFLFIEIV